MITQYVKLEFEIHEQKRKHRLLVTGLGNQQIILGFTWLKEMNPIINWKKGTLEWRKWKHSTLKKQPDDSKTIKYYAFAQNVQEKTIQEEEHPDHIQDPPDKTELSMIISTITGDMEDSAYINSKSTTATAIQMEINLKKKTLPIEDQIPKEFHEFLDIFSEEKAARFPES